MLKIDKCMFLTPAPDKTLYQYSNNTATKMADDGSVLLQRSIPFSLHDTFHSVYERMHSIYAQGHAYIVMPFSIYEVIGLNIVRIGDFNGGYFESNKFAHCLFTHADVGYIQTQDKILTIPSFKQTKKLRTTDDFWTQYVCWTSVLLHIELHRVFSKDNLEICHVTDSFRLKQICKLKHDQISWFNHTCTYGGVSVYTRNSGYQDFRVINLLNFEIAELRYNPWEEGFMKDRYKLFTYGLSFPRDILAQMFGEQFWDARDNYLFQYYQKQFKNKEYPAGRIVKAEVFEMKMGNKVRLVGNAIKRNRDELGKQREQVDKVTHLLQLVISQK